MLLTPRKKVGLNRYKMLTVIRLTVFSNGASLALMKLMRIRLRDFEIEFYLLCLLTCKKSYLARPSKLVKDSPKYRPKRSQERACPTRATFIQYREAHYPIRLPSHRSLTRQGCKQRSAFLICRTDTESGQCHRSFLFSRHKSVGKWACPTIQNKHVMGSLLPLDLQSSGMAITTRGKPVDF